MTVSAATLSHFQRIIKALTMASPLILVLRYQDGLNHCIEASICAGEALARRKITTRVVPCFAVATLRTSQNSAIPIGLTPRQMYNLIDWGDRPVPPYETWKVQYADKVTEENLNTHAVLEATLGDERALIDLTLGQLREATGVAEAKKLPWQVVLYGKGWQQFESAD